MTEPRGYILYDGPSRLDPAANVFCVLTVGSDNTKTGDMWQTWVMRSDRHPVQAVLDRTDDAICGECVHRGVSAETRSCYVNVAWAPAAVYRAYKAGVYTKGYPSPALLTGRAVRCCAYGDPAAIALPFWQYLLGFSVTDWTGYTHQWKTLDAAWAQWFMASVDCADDQRLATAAGWRTYRVRVRNETLLPQEITCPASDEAGHRTQCVRCLLCNGKTDHTDRRKSIAIYAHGQLGGRIGHPQQRSIDWSEQ